MARNFQFSVAVRPTTYEVKTYGPFQSDTYYDDKAITIIAASAGIAIEKYKLRNISAYDAPDVGLKKGSRIWMDPIEERFVRAIQL